MRRYEPMKAPEDIQVGDLVQVQLDKLGDEAKTYLTSVGLDKPTIVSSVNESGSLVIKGSDGYERFVGRSYVQHVPRRIIETEEDFEVGDRVRMRAESPYAGMSISNPPAGTEGTVSYVVQEGERLFLRVVWHREYTGSSYGNDSGFRQTPDSLPHVELVDEYPDSNPEPEKSDKTEAIDGILFGSDLELFVLDKELDKVIPAGLLVPGTKDNPFQMQNGTVHPDGLAVEVGCPPASTMTELMDNLEAILAEVKQEFFPEDKYIWYDQAGVRADEVLDIDKHRAENPSWFQSGCAPELQSTYVYRMREVMDVEVKRKRRCTDMFFCGFHIHYGFTEWDNTPMTRIDACNLVQTVGGRWNYNPLRRAAKRAEYYGGKGAFRMKPYGVEDRSLSGDVFLNNKKLAYDQAYEYQRVIKEALCK